MTEGTLGYTKEGVPIHHLKPGMMATACTISCSACGRGIRGAGGPMYGAKCPDCWQFSEASNLQNIMVLTGNVMPVSVQAIYTMHNEEAETFEVCTKDEANHVSVYLRLPNGEVAPLMDFVIEPDVDALSWARKLYACLRGLYNWPLEDGGALA